MASRFGIQPQLIDDTLYDAFGQRQVTQYFTQLNTYDVIEEILPELQGDPETLDKIYIRSPTTGQEVPIERLRQMDDESRCSRCRSAISGSSRRSRSASISRRRGARPGDGGDPDRPRPSCACRAALTTTFQGNAQAFQDSLTTVPLLILAALVAVYIILGVLYESFIHPLTILSTLPSAGLGALGDR